MLEMRSNKFTFYDNLSTLGNETSPITQWATGGTDTWRQLQQGFKALVGPFAAIAEKAAVHVSENHHFFNASRFCIDLCITTTFYGIFLKGPAQQAS